MTGELEGPSILATPPGHCWAGKIRTATPADIDAIVAVERSAFASPWPRSAFVSEIDGHRWSHVAVAEEGRTLVGFTVYWSVASELHLLNLAVDRAHRRRGIGRDLVAHLIAFGRNTRHTEVLLEVRVSNLTAITLYRHFGFEDLAIRPGYYADNGEDALVMSLVLSDTKSEQRSAS
ncbi:MAG: ribosomal protein S18-alanine N-acetyltransferase [Myxococcota bacterium]|nr:ribosomal protein S18-alanine N-acetyltransferase [Myxococcota bacterium]